MWSSITQLSEMGAKVDVGHMYNKSVSDTEKIIDSKAKVQNGKSTEATTKPGVAGAQRQKTAVKASRIESKDLQNRHLAESTLESTHAHPTSLSLGFSSHALRAPFASPGGLPTRPRHEATARREDNMPFASPGSQGRQSYSQIPGGDGSYMLPSSGISEQQVAHSETQPRALFDMSHSAITPFMKSFSLNESSTLYPMSGHRPPLASTTASVAATQGAIDSTLKSEMYHDVQASIHATMLGSTEYAPTHDDYGKPTRRVSFGPTARLSFSSMGGGAEIDLEPLHQLSHAQSSTAPEISSDDYYPQKVHRIGTSHSNSSFNQASLLVSPIPTTQSPSIRSIHMAELTRIKEGSYEDTDESTVVQEHSTIEETVKKVRPESSTSAETDIIKEPTPSAETWKEFCGLMFTFASAYQLSQLYCNQECVLRLKELPVAHFYSGFVYQLLGRAYLEMCDYKAALAALKEMIRLEPHRVRGTEMLSTVLWHLKKEKDLCALAQQVRLPKLLLEYLNLFDLLADNRAR